MCTKEDYYYRYSELIFNSDLKAHAYLVIRGTARVYRYIWGTNYFSLFVSYRFTSNKPQLTEFPESKSDMPLFLWVLALK